jgi:hypothetical protein
MRHLYLVQDDPALSDFPPGWAEFEAARQRFFARLETQAALLTLVPADQPEEQGTTAS